MDQTPTDTGGHCLHSRQGRAHDGEMARHALADAPDDEGNDLRRNEPDPWLGNAEARVLVDQHDVGTAHHAEAAADRRAFDHRNHRLGQRIQRQQRIAEQTIRGDQRIGTALGNLGHVRHGVQIAAGAVEAAFATQNQRPHRGIGADPFDGVLDLDHHVEGQSIAAGRTGKRQTGDPAVDLQTNLAIVGLVCHDPIA